MADATHFEPYVYLAGVTSDAALIAWGGFFFRAADGSGRWRLVDDEELGLVAGRRTETIGARSEPFGAAVVTVADAGGREVARAETADHNHVWVDGLEPDTRYTYRIAVDGESWAETDLWDWVPGSAGGGELRPSDRSYDRSFRTHPDPDVSTPLTFAVIGDYGWGVRADDDAGRRQRRVAESLERAVDHHDVRVLLTAGDNIYLGSDKTPEATGAEDDDWFFTYYQPYRYVISRIPVYPVVGNHDSEEEEASDDRDQLADNFFVEERFASERVTGRASLRPGLFYRFRFGSDVEFVAVDTSLASPLAEERFFDHPEHAEFLEAAMPERSADANLPRWIVPVSHHPPLCAGPSHHNMTAYLERLLPLAQRAGVRLVISGHEHNFQHSELDGIHFFVTGAAAKLRPGRPERFAEAHTRSWAAAAHFLLVEATADELRIHPVATVDENGTVHHIAAETPAGEPAEFPLLIRV